MYSFPGEAITVDLDDAVAILDGDYAEAVREAAFDAPDSYGAADCFGAAGVGFLALERLFVDSGWLSADEFSDLMLEDYCFRGERPCNLRACTELALYIGQPAFAERLALAA